VTYEFIRVEREGPLTIFTLDRPDVLNALHAPAHWELHDAFDRFALDPEQRVGILTGSGRAFSVGNDLKHQASGGSMDRPPSGFGGLVARFDLEKPLIAAVNGIAMGGGFEIALACDIIIAADPAIFAFPEPRVGMAALAGGLHRLPRTIGIKRAMGLILTARRVSAADGERYGFVNAVVPEEGLMSEARKWAAEIMACSPAALRASKQIVQKGLDEPTLEAAMNAQKDYPALKRMLISADFIEGPLAFMEKRPPIWQSE
jgi:crotonobetainyl-CoA hydratase